MPANNSPAAPMTAADKVNYKIEQRIGKTDFLEKLECAYVPYQVVLNSPVIKRVYFRFFDATQLNVHHISVYGRIGLQEEQVVQIEDRVRQSLEELHTYLNEKLRECEALFQANGITSEPHHLAPKSFVARVISPLSRKYLTALIKADQVVGMAELLVIEDLIKATRGEMLISEIRNRLRKFAVGTRTLAFGVRKMTQAALATAESRATPSDAAPEHDAPDEQDQSSLESTTSSPAPTDMAQEAVSIARQARKAERTRRKAAKNGAAVAQTTQPEPLASSPA